MQHFSILDFTQDTAVHAVDLAIRFQEGRIVTAGDEGLLFPHPGQQILLAAIIQLTEHIVQQEDGVLAGDGGSGGGPTWNDWPRWPVPITRSFPMGRSGWSYGMPPSLSRGGWRPC